MTQLDKENLLTSIDIGTTKIRVMIGRKVGEHIDIIGIGKSFSDGLHKGVVVDVAKTTEAINNAVVQAQDMAHVTVHQACIGISGDHIVSVESMGIVIIKNGIVKASDVDAVLHSAKSVIIKPGYKILHVLPKYFVVNGHDKTLDPIGMHAVQLEAYVYIVLGQSSCIQNIIDCCLHAGIKAQDLVLNQLASAESILSADEKDLGIGLLDIGGGTSDFIIYRNQAVEYTKNFSLGGNHITNDIAIGLRITKQEAERIKLKFATLDAPGDDAQECIEVEMMHGNDRQVIKLVDLLEIVEFRMKEMLLLIKNDIEKNNKYHSMINGLVITGGGSLTPGIQKFAQDIFGCPVRIGKPPVFFDLLETLQSPLYATGYGLLLSLVRNKQALHNTQDQLMTTRMMRYVKSFIENFF